VLEFPMCAMPCLATSFFGLVKYPIVWLQLVCHFVSLSISWWTLCKCTQTCGEHLCMSFVYTYICILLGYIPQNTIAMSYGNYLWHVEEPPNFSQWQPNFIFLLVTFFSQEILFYLRPGLANFM
jgi:hypothetical protein